MAPIPTFSTVDVNIAQVILEIVIIMVILLEPVQSSFMQRFINILVGALILETIIISSYGYVLHAQLNANLAMFLWDIYKLVRLFISIAFCYEIVSFIEHKVKLHLVFLVIASIIIGGGIIDHIRSIPGTPSGFNINIVFMLIFLFTLKQYYKLKKHILVESGGSIRGLNSLIAIETVLIVLNGTLIVSFFRGSTDFLQPLRLSITLVQYFKIYLIMSLFASLKPMP